jgi:transglutaminase-like putative cysteine protease
MSNKLLIAIAFFAVSTAAFAAPYRPSYTVLSSETEISVRPDGSYTEDVTEDLRVDTQSGIDDLSQYPIQYSTSMQSVRVLSAYTETPDGKRIPVGKKGMLLQQSSVSADAPMFDDSKVLNVVFPALETGARVHVKFRRVQRVPLFPGVFSLQHWYSKNIQIEAADLIVHAPQSMPMHVEAIDLAGGEVAASKPGMRTWHWRVRKNVAEVPESDAISDIDYSPRIAMSTLPDYPALARAYRARADAKAAVTPYVRALAARITHGIDDPRAQADALYRWVSRNIRYVAVYFGADGVVPHDADTIARALYGDCKDHVTLYQALLAAKGIKSSAVLVNAGQSWWLSKVAVPTGSFDHAINYLPQWNLFVDTTAAFAPFGVLPDTEAGKTALVMDDGHGQARLMTLPTTSAARDRVQVDTRLTLKPDGTVTGGSTISQQGVFDLISRSAFSGVPPGTEADAAGKLLASRGLQGSGTFEPGDIYALDTPFTYRSHFTLPDYIDPSGPTALVLPSGADTLLGLADYVSSVGGQSQRRTPMMLTRGGDEENVTLQLPPGLKVLALPRAVSVDSPLGRYEASYHQEGRSIRAHRVLTLTGPNPVLSPDDYPKLRQLMRAVSRDLRAQILLEPE